MDIKELKEEIKRNVEFRRDEKILGGQSCGMPIPKAHLVSEEIGIEIIVSNYRSIFKNRQLAWDLFELALDEIIV